MTQSTERYLTPCALPSEHERELLTILIEECAEVQQRATKLLRFGQAEVQPGQMFTNGYRLAAEIGDLLVMVEKLKRAGVIYEAAIIDGMQRKRRQLATYMQTGEAAARLRASEGEGK